MKRCASSWCRRDRMEIDTNGRRANGMSTTKTKPGKGPKKDVPRNESAVSSAGQPGEVLTLTETAAYLRIPEAEVVRLVNEQDLPGRFLGDEWRFLKSALQDWLRVPPPKPSKEALLSRIGSWENDPYWEEELKEIMKRRGRPEAK